MEQICVTVVIKENPWSQNSLLSVALDPIGFGLVWISL